MTPPRRRNRNRNRGRGPLRLPVAAATVAAAALLSFAVAPIAVASPPGDTGSAGASASASAAPPRQGAAPAAASGDVKIMLDRITPSAARRGDPITVTATIVNDGSVPLQGLTVRMRTGYRLTTRTDLANADSTPPPLVRSVGPSMPVPPLAPKQSTPVSYLTTTVALSLNQIGVYPVALTVDGRRGAGAPVQTLATARTFLPYFPEQVAAPTQVAWLVPLVDRPHRLTDGGDRLFTDDDLAAELARGGRLANLLSTMRAADTAGVPFTIAADPDLIDSVVAMTQGYSVATNGGRKPGTGTEAATSWLAQLRQLTARHEVIALPYADMDTVALVRGGLTQLAQTNPADVDTLDKELATTSTNRIWWPPGEAITESALDDAVRQGAQAVILDAASLPGGRNGSGLTRSATSPLPSGSGTAVALVTDPSLTAQISATRRRDQTGAQVEQRFLAELAMITAESPSVSRTILLAPQRRWNPSPVVAAAMLTATRSTSWLAPTTVAALASSNDLVNRGRLVYPRDAAELRGGYVQSIGTVQALITDFRSALDNAGARQELAPLNHALQRAASSAWRADPAGAESYLGRIASRIVTIRSKVYIVPPANGRYTLGGQDSVLPLTMVNELDVPVTVRIRLTTRGTVGLTVHDAGTHLLEPATGGAKRTLIRIPVTLTQAGRFQVSAEVFTPDQGYPLNQPVYLQVQSTAYGPVALGITGAALGLMLLLVARRVYRRVRSGPAAAVQPAGSPAERGR